jgi:hypothetical protein
MPLLHFRLGSFSLSKSLQSRRSLCLHNRVSVLAMAMHLAKVKSDGQRREQSDKVMLIGEIRNQNGHALHRSPENPHVEGQ